MDQFAGKRTKHRAMPCASDNDHSRHESELTLCPNNRNHCQVSKALEPAKPTKASPGYSHRNPIEIHGTAATKTRPATSATRYPQIARMPSSGLTRPIAHAA